MNKLLILVALASIGVGGMLFVASSSINQSQAINTVLSDQVIATDTPSPTPSQTNTPEVIVTVLPTAVATATAVPTQEPTSNPTSNPNCNPNGFGADLDAANNCR